MSSLKTVPDQIGNDPQSFDTVPDLIGNHLLQAKSKYKIDRQIMLTVHVDCKNPRWSRKIPDHKLSYIVKFQILLISDDWGFLRYMKTRLNLRECQNIYTKNVLVLVQLFCKNLHQNCLILSLIRQVC